MLLYFIKRLFHRRGLCPFVVMMFLLVLFLLVGAYIEHTSFVPGMMVLVASVSMILVVFCRAYEQQLILQVQVDGSVWHERETLVPFSGECNKCGGPMKEENTYVRIEPCNHQVHRSCLTESYQLEERWVCPECLYDAKDVMVYKLKKQKNEKELPL